MGTTEQTRKNLELPLTSEPSNMGMVLLTDKAREENTYQGNKDMFVSTLDTEAWQCFLDEFNERVEKKVRVDAFKEELWNKVVKFGEQVLIATGLDEKGRKGLLEKMIGLRKQKQDAGVNPCKDSSTLNLKTDDKSKTSNMIENTKILNAIEKGRQKSEKRDLDKEVESVMVVTTPPSKGIRSRKRKRETEETSPLADAISEKNLKETAPMILAQRKTAAYKSSSAPKRLAEVLGEMGASTTSGTEDDFKPQKTTVKSGSTSGQTWEVDIRKEWLSMQHQDIGKQVTGDPFERNAARNTPRPWWIALETTKELERCLKELDCGVSRKQRRWATQQKAEVNKLELGNQLGQSWESLLLEYFEDAIRAQSSALPLMANPFVRTTGQLMFTWSFAGVALEALTSHDNLKLG